MTPRGARARARARRAFTFAEIMFAVMILGIGFIMVAALFPVAIRQTQSTLEDLNGVAEAKQGEAIMRQMGTAISGLDPNYTAGKWSPAQYTNPNVPAFLNLSVDLQSYLTPHAGSPLHSFFLPGPGGQRPYDYVKGDLINQRDHRYAWLPVAYQVDQQPIDANGNPLALDAAGLLTVDPTTGSPVMVNGQPLIPTSRVLPATARVWVLAVEKRNPDSAEFTSADREAGTKTLYNNNDGAFKPKVVYFKLVEGEDPNAASGGNVYPDTLVFTDASGVPQDEPAADQGAYVWVADDQIKNVPPAPTNYYRPGAANGRFYRLGNKLPVSQFGPGVYELQPGNDMQIKHGPGPDAFYNTKDDANNYYELENLPPRPYDGAPGSAVAVHPYANPQGGTAYRNLPGPPATGFMIGRGLKDPTLPYNPATNPYVGSVQDLYALPAITVLLRPQ